jgi:hypothetical protein
VQTLQSEPKHQATLIKLADWYARSVFCRCTNSLSDVDWLAFGKLASTQKKKWFSSHKTCSRTQLNSHLSDFSLLPTIKDVCEASQLAVEEVKRLTAWHITTNELNDTVADQVRHSLFLELVELAFSRDLSSVTEFLLDGFTRVQSQGIAPSRGTLVEALLSSLIELLLLFGKPVILICDAMESLLGNPPRAKEVQAFHNGIAELVESQPGIAVFVFAESGNWQQASKYFSEYARHRWERGIPVKRQGTIFELQMPQIDADQLANVAAGRMHELLTEFYSEQPRILPFTKNDFAAIAGGEQAPPLRQVVQSLRDAYERTVFQTNQQTRGLDDNATEMGSPSDPALCAGLPTPDLSPSDDRPATSDIFVEETMRSWSREIRNAERRLENSTLNSLADMLSHGLNAWMQSLASEGTTHEGWRLVEVHKQRSGQHATYGQAVVSRWKNGDDEYQHATALLLATGRGLPSDLETKLKMTTGTGRVVDRLQILWARESDSDKSPIELLPDVSRGVWDKFVDPADSIVSLELIAPIRMAPWLAMMELAPLIAERDDIPSDVFNTLIAEQTHDLIQFVAPKISIPEKTT